MNEASRLLRWSMAAAGLAVTYAGFVLFVFPDRSEDLFTWNIQPPVTAAYLGAMYLSGTPLLFLIARRGTTWRRLRAVLPPFVTVSLGMLLATLLHSERFIWSSPVTWLWLVLYAVFPPLVVALYVQHAKRAGPEPPAAVSLSPGFRQGALAIGAVLAVLASGLIVAPRTFDGTWPWPLTPLTARASGAWLFSLGVALGAVSRERDWEAVRLIAPQGIVVGALLVAGVIRFWDSLDWDGAPAWIYVAGLVVIVIGGLALYVAMEAKRGRAQASALSR